MRKSSLVFAVGLLSSAVGAAPLRVKNAVAVRVSLIAGSQRGLGVKPEHDGWRLRLPEIYRGARAELIDVTPGTPARTVSVVLHGDEAVLDGERFFGGHVYRVQLGIDSAYVYLYPTAATATAKSGPTKLEFAGDERDSAGGPALLDKGTM